MQWNTTVTRFSVEQLLLRAKSLEDKFKQGSEIVDIEEAIVLDREALVLCNPTQPERSTALNLLASVTSNLPSILSARYDRLGIVSDIEEVIDLSRGSLELCPLDRSDRSTSLTPTSPSISPLGRIT